MYIYIVAFLTVINNKYYGYGASIIRVTFVSYTKNGVVFMLNIY